MFVNNTYVQKVEHKIQITKIDYAKKFQRIADTFRVLGSFISFWSFDITYIVQIKYK